jgi:hypothetical protein
VRPHFDEASDALGETIHLARLAVRTWSTWRHGSRTTTCARSAAWADGVPAHAGEWDKALRAEHPDDELPLGDEP